MLIRCNCGKLAQWGSYSLVYKCNECVPRDDGDRRFRKPGEPQACWVSSKFGYEDNEENWIQHYPLSRFCCNGCWELFKDRMK